MIDFISKYVWVFVITGSIIIIIAIGYLVDKLVINKNNSNKNVNKIGYKYSDQSNVNNQQFVPDTNLQTQEVVNNNSEVTDSVVVTEPLFDTGSVKEESVNIDTEKSEDSVWKV